MADEPNSLGALEPLVGYHLRRASAVFSTDFARAIDGTGMRQVLIGVLAVVAGERGINQGAVGRALGIKRANMVSLINELVDAGLVTRDIDPTDRRAFALGLTRAGCTLLAECLARIEAHERALLVGFSVEEHAMLLQFLTRIERHEPPVI